MKNAPAKNINRRWTLCLGALLVIAAGVIVYFALRTISSTSTWVGRSRATAGPADSSTEAAANTPAAFVTEQLKKGKRPNRLIHEKSPYLLQHAFNPVDWYPWENEAFEKARKENKLIFLSVGYSTCYWCHVMEREVFENEELAALMNRYFVSIKVDREERPDVDRVYMAALQAMTGGGGWPMSLFLTPDLKPFYGATYIPPADFKNLMEKVEQVWTTTPEKLRQSSEKLTEALKQQTAGEPGRAELDKSVLTKGFEQFRAGYDRQHGGFGGAPKFPRVVGLNFLLRYFSSFRDREALQMALDTLRKMAQGGVYDQIGGGFHRYSVDAEWRTPHFEKMLYDQAQLASSYLDAYQITHDEFYASVARDILSYVLRAMTGAEGGFYSAEDAESAVDSSKPQQKEEGAFYTWKKDEIDRLLSKERAGIFDYFYGVEPQRNASGPRGEPTAKSVLYVAHTVEETSRKFGKSSDEIQRILADARSELFKEREKRPHPHLDDKILVSWNGLMISAFARAYQVLDNPTYRQAAEKSADFILRKLYDPKAKLLLHRYRGGEARYQGHLEDYAFLTMGLLDLYEASLEVRWLKAAIDLTGTQNMLFEDQRNGGFFDTSGKDPNLWLRSKEDYEGAEPVGNSVAALYLLRLAQMTNNRQWRETAERTLAAFGHRLKQFPEAMPQMLVVLDFKLSRAKEIIIAGDLKREDTQKMLRQVYTRFIPNKVLMLADGGAGQDFLAQQLPFIKSVHMRDNKATAYICENYACKLPTSDLSVMAKLLSEPQP
ncbi:MAG TPA: thioredoxin domain-containing protein [Acidobacteriota bacterium]|jgi:hypothetical protein